MSRPTELNILGKRHKVEYKASLSDVDVEGRKALYGCYDCKSKTIRVYDDGTREDDAVYEDLLHEVIHVIITELSITILDTKEAESAIFQLSVGLSDFLFRNKWMSPSLLKENYKDMESTIGDCSLANTKPKKEHYWDTMYQVKCIEVFELKEKLRNMECSLKRAEEQVKDLEMQLRDGNG